MSFDVILPFLRPIANLIQDPDISEIMIVAGGRVYIERHGTVHHVPDVVLNERHVRVAAKHMARALGEDVSAARPILDARLPDGSRVAAVFPPCSIGGTTLTIRKFAHRVLTAQDLLQNGFISAEILDAVRLAIDRRDNILISGGTSTGKTTLLNALAGLFPSSDRIIVIEDTSELRLEHGHLVRFEIRRAQDDLAAVTTGDLLRATLRHRPDRIIVGEVRGAEALDLLQALNTGHSGSMSTIHANSARHALSRLATCVLQAGVGLPHAAIARMIADTVQLVLHVTREFGIRRVTEAIRVTVDDRVETHAIAAPNT
jgi:pilus assembly protein CpaF